MDSPLNPLDGFIEGVADDGRIHLPPNVSTVMAEDLRAGLVLAADHEEAIIVDAAETTSIGQAALQLLVAAKFEADQLAIPFIIENARPELVERIAMLGLADLLGISSQKGEQP